VTLYDDAVAALLLAPEPPRGQVVYSLLLAPSFHPELALHLGDLERTEQPCSLGVRVADASIFGYVYAVERMSPQVLRALTPPSVLHQDLTLDLGQTSKLKDLVEAVVPPVPGPPGRDGMQLTLVGRGSHAVRHTLSTAEFDPKLPGHAPMMALAIGLIDTARAHCTDEPIARSLLVARSYLADVYGLR
jgi:hypothetical protein